MRKNKLGYHPEYGLPDELRMKAVREAEQGQVKHSATKNRVSIGSIYKWRKRMQELQA
jgi:transposase-like protein